MGDSRDGFTIFEVNTDKQYFESTPKSLDQRITEIEEQVRSLIKQNKKLIKKLKGK
jgi:hypothetical protein